MRFNQSQAAPQPLWHLSCYPIHHIDIWVREVKIFTYIKDFVAIFFNSHEKAREIESLREENVRLNDENAKLREELNPRRGLVRGEYGVLWNQDDPKDRNQPYCPSCVFGHNRRTPLNREGEAWRCPVRECGEAYNWNPPDIQPWEGWPD